MIAYLDEGYATPLEISDVLTLIVEHSPHLKAEILSFASFIGVSGSAQLEAQ